MATNVPVKRISTDKPNVITKIAEIWGKKRAEEAVTMCLNRKPTEEEIQRAMVIGKWFLGWTEETGQCPIGISNEYWFKKLCALFEWIAMLESESINSK